MLILTCLCNLTPLYCWNIAKEGIKQHIMKIIILVFFYFQGLTYRETTSERQSTIANKDYEEENTKEDTGRVYFQILSTFSSSEFDCHLKCNLISFQFPMFNIWSVYIEVCPCELVDSGWLVWFMVFNATFNNISVISWRQVLLVEETGVCRENHRPVTSHWQTLSHNVVSSTPRHELPTSVVTGTDWLLR